MPATPYNVYTSLYLQAKALDEKKIPTTSPLLTRKGFDVDDETVNRAITKWEQRGRNGKY